MAYWHFFLFFLVLRLLFVASWHLSRWYLTSWCLAQCSLAHLLLPICIRSDNVWPINNLSVDIWLNVSLSLSLLQRYNKSSLFLYIGIWRVVIGPVVIWPIGTSRVNVWTIGLMPVSSWTVHVSQNGFWWIDIKLIDLWQSTLSPVRVSLVGV